MNWIVKSTGKIELLGDYSFSEKRPAIFPQPALAGDRLITQTWYTDAMSTTAHDILEKFDRLPESDKRDVAVEILRRTREIELPPRAFVGSPRLMHHEKLSDFKKEVIEEPHDAGV